MKKSNNRPVPDPQVVFTQIDENEAVLLHLGTKMYYSLNETGVRLWQMIESGLETEVIIAKLQEDFDITPKKAKKSISNFRRELLAEKLLVEAME